MNRNLAETLDPLRFVSATCVVGAIAAWSAQVPSPGRTAVSALRGARVQGRGAEAGRASQGGGPHVLRCALVVFVMRLVFCLRRGKQQDGKLDCEPWAGRGWQEN